MAAGSPRIPRFIRRFEWLPTPLLMIGIIGSTALLVWFGHRAIDEWRRTTNLLALQQSAEAADLVLTAFIRDMRGVQATVLGSQEMTQFATGHPQKSATSSRALLLVIRIPNRSSAGNPANRLTISSSSIVRIGGRIGRRFRVSPAAFPSTSPASRRSPA